MVQLQSNLREIEATGGQLVGISIDSADTLKRFTAAKSITYPLLSDVGGKTIDSFGIRNKDAPGRFSGIPHPATFIMDQKGVIRAKLFIEGYQERHSVESLIKALKEAR